MADQPVPPGGEPPASAPPSATTPTTPPATSPAPAAPSSSAPFEAEADVMNEGVATRDDISATQSTPAATRDVSASHIARLLYRPIEAPGGPVYQSQVLERQLRRR
ncbi:MAG TPA: hypothetical protein VFY89_06035 [Ktedonobacterales bacterium]